METFNQLYIKVLCGYVICAFGTKKNEPNVYQYGYTGSYCISSLPANYIALP